LWIINNAEAGADELRGIIDSGALQKAEGHGVDNNRCWSMSGMSTLTASRLELMTTQYLNEAKDILVIGSLGRGKLHLILVPMASS
jgi:hypothetical protein